MDYPEHCRRAAEDFAEDYRLYVEGDQSLDRRAVNAVLAQIAEHLVEELRTIDGKITTTQHNERVIRTLPWARQHAEVGAYQVEVDEVAYDASGLPADEMEAEIAGWVLGKAESIARAEADRQADIEAAC